MKELATHASTKASDQYRIKREWWKRFLRLRRKRRSRSLTAFENNVVGIGVGEKITKKTGTGVVCIKFLVHKKFNKRHLLKENRIPEQIDGVPTDVEEVGNIRMLDATSPPNGQNTFDPVQPGCSIGFLPSVPNAGTLAALVQDSKGSTLFLSSSHVLYNVANPQLPSTIVQPGALDSNSPRQVGVCDQANPLDPANSNQIDCATAHINAHVQVREDIINIGAINGAGEASVDMVVHKFGRTTGYTVGTIVQTTCNFTVPLGGNDYYFEDQIQMQSLPFGNKFGDEGDSGALILERTTGLGVGLLMAADGLYAYANHLPLVLSQLKVRLK